MNIYYDVLEKLCERTIDDLYPKLKWIPLYNVKHEENFDHFVNIKIRSELGDGQTRMFVFYFKQRYEHEKEFEYLTVVAEISKKDIIFDWDFDEGQQYREWLAYADLGDLV